jgi:hypothetical protein
MASFNLYKLLVIFALVFQIKPTLIGFHQWEEDSTIWAVMVADDRGTDTCLYSDLIIRRKITHIEVIKKDTQEQ